MTTWPEITLQHPIPVTSRVSFLVHAILHHPFGGPTWTPAKLRYSLRYLQAAELHEVLEIYARVHRQAEEYDLAHPEYGIIRDALVQYLQSQLIWTCQPLTLMRQERRARGPPHSFPASSLGVPALSLAGQ